VSRMNWRLHVGMAFTVLGLAGLIVPAPAMALSTYRMAWYYDDSSMTNQVGERSALCTSTYNWGVRTDWVARNSGSCLVEGGSSQPQWGCICYHDYNWNYEYDSGEEFSCAISAECPFYGDF
jgi:hypothetical protein